MHSYHLQVTALYTTNDPIMMYTLSMVALSAMFTIVLVVYIIGRTQYDKFGGNLHEVSSSYVITYYVLPCLYYGSLMTNLKYTLR